MLLCFHSFLCFSHLIMCREDENYLLFFSFSVKLHPSDETWQVSDLSFIYFCDIAN